MANSASAADKVAEAHQRLRANPDIQFDLPVFEPKPRAPHQPSWLEQFLASIGSPPQWAFWLVVGVIVALILWVIVRQILGQVGQGTAYNPRERDVERWRPEEKVARALLAEADALAAEGRYDEAARLLLHRSLDDIRGRKPKLLRPALTSREIGRIDALPEAVRGTFMTMASAVERSLFGGRSLGREAWEEARAAYDAFALPRSWA